MLAPAILAEFRSRWLPHVTDGGLNRLIELLDGQSPLLIHGAFTRACAMGCLATHIAWHHPRTEHLNDEAGVRWLTHVAELNPATSSVICEWDRPSNPWELRADLLDTCRLEKARRQSDEWSDEVESGELVEC